MKKILIAAGIFLCIILVVTIANCSGEDSSDEALASASSAAVSDRVLSTWVLSEFKDEFGNSTGEHYLKTTVNGTFNDVMGKDQKLKAEVRATSNGVMILLFENETQQLEMLYGDYQSFKITVLDQSNTKHQYLAYLRDGKPYLDFNNYELLGYKEAAHLLKILETPGTVSFYIVNSDDKDNTYSFSVKTDGFAELYRQILPSTETTENAETIGR